MGKLIIPIGISGSGKSTLMVKTYNRENNIIISSDEIREELTGSAEDQSRNREVFDLFYTRIEDALRGNKTVVADATNIDPRARQTLYQIAKEYNIPIDIVMMNVTLEDCISRNQNRKRKVPIEVIEKQYNNYAIAREQVEREIDELKQSGQDVNICDVFIKSKSGDREDRE